MASAKGGNRDSMIKKKIKKKKGKKVMTKTTTKKDRERSLEHLPITLCFELKGSTTV